jgi:hypothetical protein
MLYPSREVDESFLHENAEMRPPSKAEVHEILHEMLMAQTKILEEKFQAALMTSNKTTFHPPISHPPLPPPLPLPVPSLVPAPMEIDETRKLCIPSISKKGPVHLRWKQVITDWEMPDPSRGHYTPLKDWDPKWLTGANRTVFAMKYRQRKLIAMEYIEE